MSVLWYYRREGELVGPMRFDTLPGLVKSGVIRPNDEVRNGHGGWQTVLDVEELRKYLGGSTVDAGDTTSLTESKGIGASLFNSILQSAPSVEGSHSPLDRVGAWDYGASSDHKEPETPRYYLRIDRGETGPLSLALLQQRVNDGRLAKHDRCRAEGSLCWIPVREIAELTFPPTSDGEMPLPKSESPTSPTQASQATATVSGSTKQIIAPTPMSPPSHLRDTAPHQITVPSLSTTSNHPVTPRAILPQSHPAQPNSQPTSPTDSTKPSCKPSPPQLAQAVAAVPHVMQPHRSMPVPPRRPEYGTKRSFRPAVNLQVSPTMLVMVGILCLFVIVMFLPRSERTVRGKVLVNKLPVPIGSVSFSPKAGTKGPAMTVPIVSGNFRASDDFKLVAGDYDVIVTVGNPLGMPLPELKDSPVFASLNGAKLNTTASVKAGGAAYSFQFSSSDAVLPEKDGPSINEMK